LPKQPWTKVGLLTSNRDFRNFWLGRAFSATGDGAAALALLVYVQDRSGSGAAVGALLLAQTVPRVALGPVAGAIADRMDQRQVMIGSDLAQAVLFTAIALTTPPFWILLILITAATVAATAFSPAGSASLPELVDKKDLASANAWLGTAFNLQLVFGPLLGGLLVATIGIQGALAANVLSFVLSGVLIRRLPALPPATEGAARKSLFEESWDGVLLAWRHRMARIVLVSLTLTVSFAALDDVALVFLAREVLDVGAAGFSVMASAYGVGMFAIALLLTRVSHRFKSTSTYIVGMLLTGIGAVITGFAPNLAAGVAGQGIAGSGNGTQNIATQTLVQQSVPRAQRGRAFGAITSGAFLGGTLARGIGGPLLDATSPRVLFLIGGVGVIVTTLATSMSVSRVDRIPRDTNGSPP
jgi:MFS family permease